MTVYLDASFQSAWKDLDPFQQVALIQGDIYRNLEGRRTLRFTMDGQGYFLKWHRGVGWREIFKNLLSLRLPVVSAENEWQAIRLLERLGVPTMTVAAYGRRGLNPARRESFLITRELTDTISLEDYCLNWPAALPSPVIKRRLLNLVADIARTLHQAGLCHRDFYLCHFLLLKGSESGKQPTLYVIDLHRALIKRRLRQRWVVKDIAGLYFSSMDIGLTRRDLLRFLCRYRDMPLRTALKQDAGLWQAVETAALALYQRLGNPRREAE